jgi:hypothetical protein
MVMPTIMLPNSIALFFFFPKGTKLQVHFSQIRSNAAPQPQERLIALKYYMQSSQPTN